MKTIWVIYRREIDAYLKSPMGAVVGALVLLVSGIVFKIILSGAFLDAQQKKAITVPYVVEMFFGLTGIVMMVAGIILSSRLITEDRANGTITLYNTSTARDWQIVLGKYLAALTYLTVIILATLYIPLNLEGKISQGELLVGYLGLFLIGAAALAVGTFASALTSNQLIAIALGVVLNALLALIHFIAGAFDAPLGDVASRLDMYWTSYRQSFSMGILSLTSVVYYLSLIYFFLLVAGKTMEAKRWR